jgi:hypothetical protein
MPTLRPRKRASASSSSAPRLSPATTTARCRPAERPSPSEASIFPNPTGRPFRSPAAAYIEVDVLRICTRAAPARATGSPAERDRRRELVARARLRAVKTRGVTHAVDPLLRSGAPCSGGRGLRHTGVAGVGPDAGACRGNCSIFAGNSPGGAAAAERPVRIVALGDCSRPASACSRARAPLGSRRRSRPRGILSRSSTPACGDTASGGLARLDWSVPEDRCDRRARRRYAARGRSQDHPPRA